MNDKTMRRVIAPPIFVGVILLALATMAGDAIAGEKLKPLKPVPAEYANKHMPKGWWIDPKIIKEGQEIYEAGCSACHGKDGIPKMKGVRNLSAVRMNRMSDSYWFWRVSEGVPYTVMVPWKDAMTEEDRWKVIAYVHQFSHGGKSQEHNHSEIEQR